MLKNNQFDNILLEEWALLECFDNVNWKKKIIIWKWNNRYASIIHSSEMDYEVGTNWENWDAQFFFLCPINEDQPSSLHIKFNIEHSFINLNIHIVALVATNAPVSLDADIIMSKWIQWSSASLLEESVILSPKVNIKSLPILDIHAKNIQASHWAKIYSLDDDKLFYLESKWLQKKQAEWLILSSFRERMFDMVEIDKKEREEIINKYFNF